MAILQDMTQVAELSLEAQVAALKAENAKLKAKTVGGCSIRVSTKGAVSVYGMGRFPVTLYPGQWERLLGISEEIKAFIVDNASALSFKDKGEE